MGGLGGGGPCSYIIKDLSFFFWFSVFFFCVHIFLNTCMYVQCTYVGKLKRKKKRKKFRGTRYVSVCVSVLVRNRFFPLSFFFFLFF